MLKFKDKVIEVKPVNNTTMRDAINASLRLLSTLNEYDQDVKVELVFNKINVPINLDDTIEDMIIDYKTKWGLAQTKRRELRDHCNDFWTMLK